MGVADESAANEPCFESLRATLSAHRPDDAAACARTLLAGEYDDRRLLGLTADASRAVYYSGLTRCVAAVPFDPADVHLGRARPLGQAIDDPRRWVMAADREWAWLGPDFR